MSANETDTVLIIRGGTVIDGSGSPGRRADVAVVNGKISAIGENLTGDRVLDAEGCVVAPGFIDIHTHYDAQVFWDPAMSPSVFPWRHHCGGWQLWVLDCAGPSGRSCIDGQHNGKGRGHESGHAPRGCALGL